MHGGEGRPLIVYGGGDHGHVVAEAAEASGWKVIGFLDDEPRLVRVGRWPLIDPASREARDSFLVVGIGDNAARQRICTRDAKIIWRLQNVVHPTAWVSPSAELGRGVFVGPLALVHTAARLGDGVILNSGGIVEHHNTVGAYAHIGPNAVLGGNVAIGELTLVGLGASVLPKLTVARRCTIGAGAAVVKNVGDDQTVVGVPGKAR